MKNFTSLVKESFKIYSEKKTIWPVLLICLIGVLAISSLYSFLGNVEENVELTQLVLWSFLFFGITIIVCIASVFLTLILIVLIIKSPEAQLKDILRESWLKLGQGLGVFILTMLFGVLGILLFIIPGIVIGIFLCFSLYICVIENKKGMDALKGSWNLVKGNWWNVFWRVFLLNIIFSAIYFLFVAISVYGILPLVFQSLFIPFNIIYMYLVYLDLKKIAENKTQSESVISANE
ncbi:MAG: glycerophosphoryl diester phosphodiesterase membrane domain-containing protein [Candidatus Pacebacteria bacterium]|nr:glycerophosphoryl diester phosphodiesterase membrane domain-containing protein [Candidatus Paceibacterota bacterium]